MKQWPPFVIIAEPSPEKMLINLRILGLHKEKGINVNAPWIKECPVNIECKVKDVIRLGTHDMFIGEVVSVNAEEGIVYPDGGIDYEKIRMLTYFMNNYFKNIIIKK